MKIDIGEISIQKISKQDLQTLIGWASAEGWNPGTHDVDVFWNTDPDGFYGVKLGDKLIAGGAIISYQKAFGFMGLFIVDSHYRSQGIGNALWHKRKELLMGRLNSNASIGMDGILAMQPYYQKGGFNVAFRDERYELQGKEYRYSEKVTPILPEDFEEILEYDSLHFGFQRSAFLKQWLTMPDSSAIKFNHENEIVGYAVVRKAEKGYRIGPLFAQNDLIAEELLKCCLSNSRENEVYLDVPTINENTMKLVQKYNGKYIFECARMYFGQAPHLPMNELYGITSFELG
jgi:hypothetical protein